MNISISLSEILYQCSQMGYTIEVETTPTGKRAVFCCKFWVTPRRPGQEYSLEWTNDQIRKDQVLTLLQKAGLTIRAKVEDK